ncbi:phage baseplate upper protein [Enterococcus hirae]|nr:phage baseplate upper protein [Enterococcus hirae]
MKGVLEMKYKKLGKIKAKTKVKGPHHQDSGFIFYSYDKGSAALEFLFRNQDGGITDLTNTTFKILFTIEKDGQEKKFTAIDSQPIIHHPERGIVTYPLPDQLLNHEGEVKGYVYLDFEDGSHSDELAFSFTIVRSKIDQELETAGSVYIKDFEQIKTEVKEAADQAKSEINQLLPELTNEILSKLPKGTVVTVEHLIEGFRNGYFEFTRTLDFSDRGFSHASQCFVGSDTIEAEEATFPSPDSFANEIDRIAYEKLLEVDDRCLDETLDRADSRLLLQGSWDIYSDIQNWLGETYFMCLKKHLTEERIKAINNRIASITPVIVGKGISIDEEQERSQAVAAFYNTKKNSWEVFGENEKDQLEWMKAEIESSYDKEFIDQNGIFHTLLATSKGNQLRLSCDYMGIEYKYQLYLSDILYLKDDTEIEGYRLNVEMLLHQIEGVRDFVYGQLDELSERLDALEKKAT